MADARRLNLRREQRSARANAVARARAADISHYNASQAGSPSTAIEIHSNTVHPDSEDPESATTEPEDEGDLDEDGEIQVGEEDEEEEEEEDDDEVPPSPTLREISSLASWTVSTYKPGCGVKELLSSDMMLFWQSDGPQPHLLTIHFFKVVSIVRMRIYLHQELDESYTPTRMTFLAGMGEHDLVEFGEWKVGEEGSEPRGWVDVDLDGVGGRDSGRGYGNLGIEDDDVVQRGEDDGKVLRCMVVQIRVLENHQNGKDTHVRGVQLFARDDKLKRTIGRTIPITDGHANTEAIQALQDSMRSKSNALIEPEWAREVELR